MHNRWLTRRMAAGICICTALTFPAQALTVQQAGILLERYYIDPIPPAVLDQISVEDMLEALGDPYTQYFTAEEYREFLGSMSDSDIVGIGVISNVEEDGLLLTMVLEGSPAQAAGLQPGDLLVAVDGVSLAEGRGAQGSERLKGEAGTQVRITYRRAGTEYTVTITRAAVTVPATLCQMLPGGVGYLDCDTFGPETAGHFQNSITKGSEVRHWVVDLRNNGGGETKAAVSAIGAFTGISVVGSLRGRSGWPDPFVHREEALTSAPLIVLTNGYTASSSEIMAASVRDMDRGLVVGGRTYGKGVAQALLDGSSYPEYFDQGEGMKITTARYYSPDRTTTDVVGVIPHLLVPSGQAKQAALLLSGDQPVGACTGYLRLRLADQYWYLNLNQAVQEDSRGALEAILSAIPDQAGLWLGEGQSWREITPQAAAEQAGVAYEDRSFTDTADSPYCGEIDLLATYYLLSGTGAREFLPREELTRAQLCSMLAQAMNCMVPSGESAFSDVPMDAWYGPAVNALAQMGLVSGVGNGLFRPDDLVTHEQYFAIMGSAARFLNYNFDQSYEGATLASESLAGYASWAKEGVWRLSDSQGENLLWAEPEEIDPQQITTREEAAALLCNLFTYTNLIPR
ncbi:PDZ domain-containing protein [Pseudoflavonifractor sp. 524-17]|uniref:S41 family peptidase n=1 Tax=Pseudoflavonifractor sp. 524-17 TaxID=2304577 RepID=UPI00137B6673|nr:S41 family peptidase [Pseudoflavonifractor sp. 524-17]NCE65378.1 PDZ domain-containing protein [Pseudoflavonifractor sp. 524-17]